LAMVAAVKEAALGVDLAAAVKEAGLVLGLAGLQEMEVVMEVGWAQADLGTASWEVWQAGEEETEVAQSSARWRGS
jgi:hypothetical protein